MIYVLAARHQIAVEWCLEHGVKPFARSTRLLSTPDSTRGVTLEAEDTVVLLSTADAVLSTELREAWQFVETTMSSIRSGF